VSQILGIDLDVRQITQFEARLRQLNTTIPRVALVNAAGETEKRIVRLLLQPTAGWSHRPDISAEITFHGGRDVELQVTINDQIYTWVSGGTRPHVIRPKGPGYPLRFQSGYKAKTIPGSLTPSGGGKFGPEVRAFEVHHPGTAPRRFVETASEKVELEIPRILQAEIERELSKLLGSFGGL